MKTPKGKLVRTKMLYYNETVVPPMQMLALATTPWLVQDDITIIGGQVIVDIFQLGTGLDSGNLIGVAELSRTSVLYQDGSIMEVRNTIDAWECTVGINANQIAMGWSQRIERMFFPEGYGIDIDDGERVYLNHYANHTMSNDKSFYFYGLIYYVER